MLVPRNGLLLLGADSPRAAALAAHARAARSRRSASTATPTWRASDAAGRRRAARAFKVHRHGTLVRHLRGAAARRAQRPQRARRHRRRARRSASTAGAIAEGLRSVRGRQAPPGAARRRSTASRSTTTSRTIRPPSPRRIAALRLAHPTRRIWAIFEPRSASSCLKVFQSDFVEAFEGADQVVVAPVFRSKVAEDRAAVAGGARRRSGGQGPAGACRRVRPPTSSTPSRARPRSGDLVVVMSNGGFDGVHDKLLDALGDRAVTAVRSDGRRSIGDAVAHDHAMTATALQACAAQLEARLGPGRVTRRRAARAAHDVQGRRRRRLAGRGAQRGRAGRRRPHAPARRPRASRRSAAARTCWSATAASAASSCSSAIARSRREDATGVRAGAGVTINGLVRWLVGQGLAGLEAWAGTPGTVGGALHGNAHFKGVNIGDLVRDVRVLDRRGDARARWPRPRWRSATTRSRLQTLRRDRRVGRVHRGDRRAGRAARRRPRLARLPQAHAAARRAERRLHLPEPRPGARPRARRHPVVGRRARRSRRPQGRARGRRAGVAAARQLHRPRRRRHGARHPRPGRALPAGRAPSASACGCAKRSSTSASSTDRPRPHGPHTTMSTLLIEGGRRLSGRITVDGNKNSALPLRRRLPAQRRDVPSRERAAHLGHPRDGRPAHRPRRPRSADSGTPTLEISTAAR